MNDHDFVKLEGVHCPLCGAQAMYEDKNEEGDFYHGTGAYCGSCGAGGYINMCLSLPDDSLDQLKRVAQEAGGK